MMLMLAVAGLLAQDDDVARGRREFTSRCSFCHFVPDTSLRTDRAWLEMVKTTA